MLSFITNDFHCVIQPVVNISTGLCFGYEATPRHRTQPDIHFLRDIIDDAANADILEDVQLRLWDMALASFIRISNNKTNRLFLSTDSRVFNSPRFTPEKTKGLFDQYGVPESAVVIEICSLPNDSEEQWESWVKSLKSHNCRIALAHYGTVSNSTLLLHLTEPDFIRIDPFFVRGIAVDSRKRLILSHMVGAAHLLGVTVIANGVDTEKDFFTCRELGFDLVQGRVVLDATSETDSLPPVYEHIAKLSRTERRYKAMDQKIILDQMERVQALPIDSHITEVFERLRQDTLHTFVPVVDQMYQPLGIVRESVIKNYVYSPFGKDLISNKGLGRKLRDFVVRCPIADINQPVENIMSIYSGEDDAEGIMMVDQMRYVGFLTASSIIRVINEKSLTIAREQNPLTKLPGNVQINQFINESLTEHDTGFVYAYIDFDNFKPFNDKYGFRQGDRAILLFAEMMRKQIGTEHFFGHIGGDDFFIGFRNLSLTAAEARVQSLLERFRTDAESFYDEETRSRGFIQAVNREGTLASFPLLCASAAIVEVPVGREQLTPDDVSTMIAGLKKPSKNSPTKTASGLLTLTQRFVTNTQGEPQPLQSENPARQDLTSGIH